MGGPVIFRSAAAGAHPSNSIIIGQPCAVAVCEAVVEEQSTDQQRGDEHDRIKLSLSLSAAAELSIFQPLARKRIK